MSFLDFPGLQYFYNKYLKPIKPHAREETIKSYTVNEQGHVPDAQLVVQLKEENESLQEEIEKLNSALTEDEKFLPPKASQNTFSNPLHIDTSGSYNIYEMKPGCVATEDASELSGSPVTEGAFYAWRELFWIPNASKNGGGKCIVRLTEAYPIPGRIWIAAYNTDISEWSQWAEIMPSS